MSNNGQKLIKPVKKLKEAILRHLMNDSTKLDEPYLLIAVIGGEKNSWTRRELAEEIKGDTDMGAEIMLTLINFTASQLLREKIG